jgi:hypothetical protein
MKPTCRVSIPLQAVRRKRRTGCPQGGVVSFPTSYKYDKVLPLTWHAWDLIRNDGVNAPWVWYFLFRHKPNGRRFQHRANLF